MLISESESNKHKHDDLLILCDVIIYSYILYRSTCLYAPVYHEMVQRVTSYRCVCCCELLSCVVIGVHFHGLFYLFSIFHWSQSIWRNTEKNRATPDQNDFVRSSNSNGFIPLSFSLSKVSIHIHAILVLFGNASHKQLGMISIHIWTKSIYRILVD